MDDSGVGDPEVFVLAGYVSSVEKWETFTREWSAILSIVPTMESLHMSDFYHRLSEPRIVERLRAFYRVIEQNVVSGFSLIIPMQMYKARFSNTKMSNPYSIAWLDLLRSMADLQHLLTINEPIDFVFDDKDPESRYLLNAFATFKRTAKPEYKHLIGATPIFRNDKKVLPLQAADFIAWWSRRLWLDKHLGRTLTKTPWHPTTTFPSISLEWTQERIDQAYELFLGSDRDG